MPDPLLSNQRDSSQVFGAIGTATLGFGAAPGTANASVTVNAPGINANAVLEAWIVATATADHSADEHWADPPVLTAGNIVPGKTFTIYGQARQQAGKAQYAYGAWSVGYRWSN